MWWKIVLVMSMASMVEANVLSKSSGQLTTSGGQTANGRTVNFVNPAGRVSFAITCTITGGTATVTCDQTADGAQTWVAVPSQSYAIDSAGADSAICDIEDPVGIYSVRETLRSVGSNLQCTYQLGDERRCCQ